MARDFVSTAEVAGMLGLPSPDAFRRKLARLQADGFPGPMPHVLRGRLWRRDQVQYWIDTRGLAGLAPGAAGENVVLLRRAGAA